MALAFVCHAVYEQMSECVYIIYVLIGVLPLFCPFPLLTIVCEYLELHIIVILHLVRSSLVTVRIPVVSVSSDWLLNTTSSHVIDVISRHIVVQ